MSKIHPTAIVESHAELGNDVTIGPFCYIAANTSIGDGCILDARVSVLPHTTIGNNCHLHGNTIVGDLPQDVAFNRETISYVKIGNNNVLREGVTIHRGTKSESETVVGDRCLLMAYSHLAHNVSVGNDTIVANGALVAGYAEIGDRVFISGNCLVHQFVRVGRMVMMSGGSAVQKDIPPFCMTAAMRPNQLMGLNVVGLKRAGFKNDEREMLRQAFKLLYSDEMTTSESVDRILEQFDSPLVREMCDFVRASTRGICKMA
jgi:UDP-N-acetylglucosamine acyltransferase